MTSLTDLYEARVGAGDLKHDPGQAEAVVLLDRLRGKLAEAPRRGLFARKTEPVKGLYLWGDVGRGKSMLMDMFVAATDVAKRRVHFHAFMQEVHAALHEARKSQTEDALRPVGEAIAKELRLLALDEMQVTDIADAMILGRLFQILFDKGVTVVTTSNRPPDDLYKDGLNRALFLPFIALIKERLTIHRIVAEADYRLGRLAGETRWFTPPDRAAMDEVWNRLTDGASRQTLMLSVKSRQVELPGFASGVARATFWDLCGQPHGPSDYLAIAGAIRVLLLEEIPVLSSENFNQAKRMVTLIDALYEAKVRLVASADAQPENLYVEGTGAFEFNRTVSRIREMTSDGWGAD